MRQIVTREDVAKAIQDLAAQGKKPTLAAIHAALDHRGSMSTLVRLKAEIDAALSEPTESEAALKSFREVWRLAVEDGRRQQQAQVQELREGMTILANENERLEGSAVAARNRMEDLEKARVEAEVEHAKFRTVSAEELEDARKASTEATSRLAAALEELAECQSARVVEVKLLQDELKIAVQKSHELELKLVRGIALMEAKNQHFDSRAKSEESE